MIILGVNCCEVAGSFIEAETDRDQNDWALSIKVFTKMSFLYLDFLLPTVITKPKNAHKQKKIYS